MYQDVIEFLGLLYSGVPKILFIHFEISGLDFTVINI